MTHHTSSTLPLWPQAKVIGDFFFWDDATLPTSFVPRWKSFSPLRGFNKRLLRRAASHHNLQTRADLRVTAAAGHRGRHGFSQSFGDCHHTAHRLSAGHKHICRCVLGLVRSIFIFYCATSCLTISFLFFYCSTLFLFCFFSLMCSFFSLFHSLLFMLPELHEKQNFISTNPRVLGADCHGHVSYRCHHVSVNEIISCMSLKKTCRKPVVHHKCVIVSSAVSTQNSGKRVSIRLSPGWWLTSTESGTCEKKNLY